MDSFLKEDVGSLYGVLDRSTYKIDERHAIVRTTNHSYILVEIGSLITLIKEKAPGHSMYGLFLFNNQLILLSDADVTKVT